MMLRNNDNNNNNILLMQGVKIKRCSKFFLRIGERFSLFKIAWERNLRKYFFDASEEAIPSMSTPLCKFCTVSWLMIAVISFLGSLLTISNLLSDEFHHLTWLTVDLARLAVA